MKFYSWEYLKHVTGEWLPWEFIMTETDAKKVFADWAFCYRKVVKK
jgi:hypothetical protein